MRTFKILLMMLLLSVSAALAETPTDLVKSIYSQWDAIRPCTSEVEVAFFEKNKDRFESSLYSNILKAYSYNDQMWPGADLLRGGQVSCFGYVVNSARVNGDAAEVDVFCRQGLDRKRSEVRGRKVQLKRLNGAWQIVDIDEGGSKLRNVVQAYLDYQAKNK